MNTVIIIPARYESSRFPGKPLVDILGKSLIQRVYEKCKEVPNCKLYVATDDDRIKNHCEKNEMNYIETSSDCLTGTDRVFQAYYKLGKSYDCIINVQGDEPCIKSDDISKVINSFYDRTNCGICCGFCKIKSEEEFRNQNTIKVVFNNKHDLLYASRAPIPSDKKSNFNESYKQVCIYAFSPSIYLQAKKSRLENIEDIEILRFLEYSYKIRMVEVSNNSISVDIPEDINKVIEKLRSKQ